MSRVRRPRLKLRLPQSILMNRLLYIGILLAVSIYAWVSGERVLYVGALVLMVLPILSYVITFAMLRGLKVKQAIPSTIVKKEDGVFKVRLHNVSPLPFVNVEFVFYGDEHAIYIPKIRSFTLNPFNPMILKIPFHAVYRGQYKLGLKAVQATDIAGLFRLKRDFNKHAAIIALPRIVDFDGFPLAMNLLTQAHSRFDIRDEDYATISDIRPYLPTDSIKRVHWKLTAKRNEWLVKIFQANALNQVKVIVDNLSLPIHTKERYALEDSMIEMSISLARFCLNNGMPVDFIVTEGHETKAKAPQEFESIYNASAALQFNPEPGLNPLAVLTHVVNEATGYANVVIFTARLDKELCERVLSAVGNGHYIAVMYFATEQPDAESEEIFRFLVDGNIACERIAGEV